MSEQEQESTPKKNPMRVALALIPLALFSALAYVFLMQLSNGGNSTKIPSPLLNKPVPEFAMPALEGLTSDGVQIPGLKTADLKGKVSLVNVWASWCVPCRAEHPVIVELGKDKRLQLVGINYKDKPGNALRFLGQLGNPFSAVGTDIKGRAAIDWGVYGIPETFVVDRSGTIRYKYVGPLSGAALARVKSEIEAALAAK